MVKKQLLYRAAAATVLGLSLTTGVAGASPHHNNNHNHGTATVGVVLAPQSNDVSASNDAKVITNSGDSTVEHNHRGGDATTGSATGTSTQTNTGTVTNASTPMVTPDNTSNGNSHTSMLNVTVAPQSNNVEADNNAVVVTNSGDAKVENNGHGGNATTGPATSTSTQTNTLTNVGNTN